MNFNLFFSMILGAQTVFASGVSAFRQPMESSQQARARTSGKSSSTPVQMMPLGPRRSPPDITVPMAQLNVASIPEISSEDVMLQQFKYIRDTRFVDSQRPGFPRRITWLFPDDGCYARAEEVALQLMEKSFVTPKKLFAFGDLTAKTPNSLSGFVTWWYHVAVVYRVGSQVYLFDAAIEPSRPITLEEWYERIGGEAAHIGYSICEARTYDTDADCMQPEVTSKAEVENEEKGFFQDEWSRIQRLNRNPEKELGDGPPWL